MRGNNTGAIKTILLIKLQNKESFIRFDIKIARGLSDKLNEIYENELGITVLSTCLGRPPS